MKSLQADAQPKIPIVKAQVTTQLLFEGQVECVVYHSDMGLSLRMIIHPTSLRMMNLRPIQKLS